MTGQAGLSETEIMALVHDYIGVEDGYLCGFTYRQHEAFYPRFCNTTIDVAALRKVHGTTRETFVAILRAAKPQLQAQIVEGVFAYLPIEKFPAEARGARDRSRARLLGAVLRLRGHAIALDDLGEVSAAVRTAIDDAELLIRERGSASGVDRVHTSLHGYLRALCKRYEVPVAADADMGKLFKALRDSVPELAPGVARPDDVRRLQGALASIVDALNPIRNQASLAHPNEVLLATEEAALAIDCARTLLNYLNRKLTAT